MNEQTNPVPADAADVPAPAADVPARTDPAPDYKSMYEALRREHDVLLHNAEMSVRAPVRGVSGGAPAEPAVDDFTRGFDSDKW